jgi:hypothetical protein
MNKDDNRRLIEIIIKECQDILVEVQNSARESDMNKFGCPPEYVIVRYHDSFNTKGFKIGKILSAWKISKEKIEMVDNMNIQPEIKPVDGMYFKEGNFLFSIDFGIKRIILEWFVGPRFGRGFTYNIDSIGNEFAIKRDKLLWIS